MFGRPGNDPDFDEKYRTNRPINQFANLVHWQLYRMDGWMDTERVSEIYVHYTLHEGQGQVP